MGRLLDQPGYGRFWTADTISLFGSNFTNIAMPVLATFTFLGVSRYRVAQFATSG